MFYLFNNETMYLYETIYSKEKYTNPLHFLAKKSTDM